MRSLMRNMAQKAGAPRTNRPMPRSQYMCPACRGRAPAEMAGSTAYSPRRRMARPFSTTRWHWLSNSNQAAGAKESLLPANFYEYFPQTLGSDAIPPKGPFAIDGKVLRKEFLQLQAKAHPDMVGTDKKRQAEGLSARINEAYKTLQDPLKRAQYLLSLKGIDVAEDETAKVEDPDLLMEVLETRETIEEAQEESDLDELKTVNDKRIADSVESLTQAFSDDDAEAAKAESVRLRYWTNIKESIDGWEKGKPVVLVH